MLLKLHTSRCILHCQGDDGILFFFFAFFVGLLPFKLDNDSINPKWLISPSANSAFTHDGIRFDLLHHIWDSAQPPTGPGLRQALNLSTNHDIIASDALSIGKWFCGVSVQHAAQPPPNAYFHLHLFTYKIPFPLWKLRYIEMTEKLSPKAAIKWEALISPPLSNRFL